MRTLARWTASQAASVLGAGEAELHRVATSHHAIIISGVVGDLDLRPLASRGVVVAVTNDTTTPASTTSSTASSTADVVLAPADIDGFVERVDANPRAAVVCARQLRLVEALGPETLDGALAALEAESLAYATLQGGTEFAEWLQRQPRRVRRADEGSLVAVTERSTDGAAVVDVTLDRSRLKNSIDAALRNQLIEILDALAYRSDVSTIALRGNGSSFSIGGDLAEFGTVDNPTEAHLIRLATSIAARLIRFAHNDVAIHAYLHGTVIGAGVELAAFGDTVVARPDATFQLPELSLGLLPGAGGTVSLTRRVGRQQAARLILLGQAIGVEQAAQIGLIDRIEG